MRVVKIYLQDLDYYEMARRWCFWIFKPGVKVHCIFVLCMWWRSNAQSQIKKG